MSSYLTKILSFISNTALIALEHGFLIIKYDSWYLIMRNPCSKTWNLFFLNCLSVSLFCFFFFCFFFFTLIQCPFLFAEHIPLDLFSCLSLFFPNICCCSLLFLNFHSPYHHLFIIFNLFSTHWLLLSFLLWSTLLFTAFFLAFFFLSSIDYTSQ